ncbi:signal peptide peptidase SppA [Bacillus lacus]|uniref:Signal peptide peptidase SppA n=1 Tax=Metabacillus lacus TaxID=1983721 RepID=A0A7X2IY32_9BACI|nr:signal peptide peptidase SppA [Metabacillus lacus]MRX71724.1 signal peptide peptidase SppA [Metabacillus lacus]
MNGKRWSALIIAAVLFVFASITSILSIAGEQQSAFSEAFSSSEAFSENVLREGSPNQKIAVLTVDGVIQDTGDAGSLFATGGYHHQNFLKMIDKAAQDESIQGVILKVNSPGGGVVESAELHKHLMKLKEETDKPVYASMTTTAASGGYYISTAADKIFAAPDTLTGSLGVIMQGINYSGLAEMYGVEFNTIKSGPYKDIMSPAKEMSEEERDILQSMVDNAYQGFVDVIAEGRDMSEQQVRSIADGRIYDGRQAKENNLIDELAYFDDVIEILGEDLELSNPQVIEYKSGTGLGSLLSMSSQKIFSDDFKLLSMHELFTRPNSSRLMYLYAE